MNSLALSILLAVALTKPLFVPCADNIGWDIYYPPGFDVDAFTYRFETSTNLQNWQTELVARDAANTCTYNPNGRPNLFFRLVCIPQ